MYSKEYLVSHFETLGYAVQHPEGEFFDSPITVSRAPLGQDITSWKHVDLVFLGGLAAGILLFPEMSGTVPCKSLGPSDDVPFDGAEPFGRA